MLRALTSRKVLFRSGAVAIGLLPFVLLEVALRLLGAGQPNHSETLAGFNRNFPLFEKHGAVYRTSAARQPFFCPQEFAADKPANSFRAFCFGGSTVYGHPYQSDTAFPKWLELELIARDPGRNWQVINCGGISYASFRLTPIVKEVLQHRPDLIIVATGENEFLEDRTYQSVKSRSTLRATLEDTVLSLRTVHALRHCFHMLAQNSKGQLPTDTVLTPEVQPKLDERSGYASYHRDDQWRQKVCDQFEESLRAIVRMCQAARVPVILVKLGSNLRDCPPFKSEHKPTISTEQDSGWQTAFDAATEAEASVLGQASRLPSVGASIESQEKIGTSQAAQTDQETGRKLALLRALELYRQAESLDSEYALLAFRIARLLDQLGQKPEALQYYLRAKEFDVCPLRLINANEEILEKVSTENHVGLVDATGRIAAMSLDQIPGNDTYLDHVHPTIGGHQTIAQAIVAQMQTSGMLTNGENFSAQQRQKTYAQHLSQLPPLYLADGRRRVEWLENWARRQRLFEETIPKDPDGWLRLGFRRLELDDQEGGKAALSQALESNPSLAELLRKHGADLRAQGREELAEQLGQAK